MYNADDTGIETTEDLNAAIAERFAAGEQCVYIYTADMFGLLDSWGEIVPGRYWFCVHAETRAQTADDSMFSGWCVLNGADAGLDCWLVYHEDADEDEVWIAACPTKEAALTACHADIHERDLTDPFIVSSDLDDLPECVWVIDEED